MARPAEEVLRVMIGQMVIQIASLTAQVEKSQEDLAAAKTVPPVAREIVP